MSDIPPSSVGGGYSDIHPPLQVIYHSYRPHGHGFRTNFSIPACALCTRRVYHQEYIYNDVNFPSSGHPLVPRLEDF